MNVLRVAPLCSKKPKLCTRYKNAIGISEQNPRVPPYFRTVAYSAIQFESLFECRD
jgi:hypothetical protein